MVRALWPDSAKLVRTLHGETEQIMVKGAGAGAADTWGHPPQ